MKKLYLFCILIFIATNLNAQYNNEWISFQAGQPQSSQQYFRIAVWKEGIYKLTYNDLQLAGVDTNNWFQPSRFQLYYQGKEQFIEVVDNGQQGIFRTGDFILFYGKPNIGELDSKLYDSASFQPNPYYSLFNDTAVYFLTYNPAVASARRVIIENDVNFSGFTAQSEYVAEEIEEYHSEYNISIRDAEGVADNSYTAGEGFVLKKDFCYKTVPFSQTFQVSQLSGNTAEIEVTVAGGNLDVHFIKIFVNGTEYINDVFYTYDMRRYNFTATNITNGTATVTVAPQDGPGVYRNYVHVGYIKIKNNRGYNFSGINLPYHFNTLAATGKAYVELNNLSVTDPCLYVLKDDTLKKVLLDKSASLPKGLIPSNGSPVHCLLTDSAAIYSSAGNVIISPAGNNGYFTNFIELGSNKDFLIVSNKLIWNKAVDYGAYRDSTGHSSLLADVDELYDQFAWGIKKHPLSIRNYADYLIDNTSPKPKYLFLIGKAVMSNNARTTSYNANLVPTFGEPSSDMMFTSRLNGAQFIPELATGRLAAIDENDVMNYLDKVRVYEATQGIQSPQEWMKRVLHFGGGSNFDEQFEISGKLSIYKSIIEDTLFGGHVETFLKNSVDPIQVNQSQYLKDLIDDGCSMMTFYGHAAGSGFDISTDAPENYTNYGRYPVILAQSCYVGDIHSTSRLLNERFVLAKNKAAIAFLAVADKAYVEDLDIYSTRLHKQLFRFKYGSTLGESMQSTIDSISGNTLLKGISMNMTLHGDPALKMNLYDSTELKVSDPEIFYTPAVVTTQTENFDVNIIVSNLGKTRATPFQLKLTRIFSNGTTKDTSLIITALHFKDTVKITLPVDFQSGSGLNQFNVIIDEDNVIPEYDDLLNNRAFSQLIINSNDINPVYPQQYAIVPNAILSLKATTANLFASAKSYRFEIDTNSHFISPFQAGVVTGAGIISYTIPFSLDSNLVYYWRVANDSVTAADTSISNKYQWKNSSFIYKPGITGWSQAHYQQFNENKYTNLIYSDNVNQAFQFVSDSNSLQALNFFTPVLGNADPGVYLNNSLVEGGGCGSAGNSFALVVLDSLDNTLAWNTQAKHIGQYNTYSETIDTSGQLIINSTCRARPEKYFLFPYNNQAYVDSLVAVLTDSVPCGNYIVLWSGKVGANAHFDFSSVHSNLFSTISAMGAPGITALNDSDIFILFTRKCDPSSTILTIGNSANPNIVINTLIGGRWNQGFATSTLIGPAMNWNSMNWSYHNTETVNSQDSISLYIYGVDSSGKETLLIDSITPSVPLVNGLNSQINPAVYPYLKLKSYNQDVSSTPTPPQLDKWQVHYQPVPEGSLNTLYYTAPSDTIQEGDDVSFSIAFENISTIAMDTLLVKYFIYDNNNVKHDIASKRLHRTLPAGDTIMASITFNTMGYGGNNTLWIDVNPDNDQPEQYHFNNITSIPFKVSRDITNPLLDVTFDGVHILNGDIISAKPGILIQLIDENKFIALNDTSNFLVRIKYPSGNVKYLSFEQNPGVSTNPDLLKWTPASLPKNSFKIEYNSSFPEDGIYELIVQASDESGNLSGSRDYRIQFEVINKSTITNVVNYPNPFSTATRFVFVLTGSEIPPDFNIQIMTVTGKVIRTITRQELGTIHIGRNITDYAWNGRDEFGDQLANGVYLYRVMTRLNGESIEQRETSADQYFTKGWGKMYLIR
jgi:Peptidase family C25